MTNKTKHLEFIQTVINRMNSNSFVIKGWAIVLISGLFALAAKDADSNFALVAYIPLFMSWILDGFFISRERQYRKLYDKTRKAKEPNIDFSMDTSEFNHTESCWKAGFFSKTLLLFYGVLLALTIIVMFLFHKN